MKAIWILLLLAVTASAQSWQKDERKDAFSGEVMVQFSIAGKFLTPPAHGKDAAPVLSVICSRGKLKSAIVGIGAPVQLIEEDRTVVKYRLDDGPAKEDAWAVSSDMTAVLPWPEEASQILSARKLVIAASELESSDVVMEFAIPDAAEVVKVCASR